MTFRSRLINSLLLVSTQMVPAILYRLKGPACSTASLLLSRGRMSLADRNLKISKAQPRDMLDCSPVWSLIDTCELQWGRRPVGKA